MRRLFDRVHPGCVIWQHIDTKRQALIRCSVALLSRHYLPPLGAQKIRTRNSVVRKETTMFRLRIVFCLVSLVLMLMACGDKDHSMPPNVGSDHALAAGCSNRLPPVGAVNDTYLTLNQCGFTVQMHRDLYQAFSLAENVYTELAKDLTIIVNTVPSAAVDMLSGVTIWLELDVPAFPGGVYHPNEVWLIENGYPAAWAGGIQFGNAENFLAWRAIQPAMVLHELAHALDHQFFNNNDAELATAYRNAIASGNYDLVSHADGSQRSAYALTNAREYFAESTEAYFWRNDFFPFDQSQLRLHDPGAIRVVERMWQVFSN